MAEGEFEVLVEGSGPAERDIAMKGARRRGVRGL